MFSLQTIFGKGDKFYTLLENSAQADAKNVTLEKVTIPIVPVQSGALPYENNELDLTALQTGDLKRLRTDPKTQKEVFRYPFPGTWYLLPQVTKAPFDNVKVRRAVGHAIDRENVVKVADGFAIPAHSMIPTGFPGAVDDKKIRDIMLSTPIGAPEVPSTIRACEHTPEQRRATYEAAWRKGGLGPILVSTYCDILTDRQSNEWLAEFVRDNALAVSGLLSRKMGGPSVFPHQPGGYWTFLNFPPREWEDSEGEDRYRRGLYTWWQRTFLHPSLLAFDAPTREECVALFERDPPELLRKAPDLPPAGDRDVVVEHEVQAVVDRAAPEAGEAEA